MTENRWLIVLTLAAVAVSVVAGVAVQKAKAQSATASTLARKTAGGGSVEATGSTVLAHSHPATASVAASTTSTVATTAPVGTTIVTTTRTTATASAAKKSAASKSVSASAQIRAAAAGDLVQFGRFHDEPLYWRVLSLDAKRIVLLSDRVVIAGAYQSDEYVSDPDDYAGSSVRTWLKGVFVPAAFGSQAESDEVLARSSASDAIAGDIAYLLTPSQLQRYLPEAEDRVAQGTAWASSNAGYGDVALASGQVYWWLAPEPGSEATNVASVVQTNGAVNGRRYAAIASDGVRPAIKLNAAALSLTAVSGAQGVYSVTRK